MKLAASIGAAIVALHGALFAWWVPDCRRDELAVSIVDQPTGETTAAAPDIDDVTVTNDGVPGLQLTRYSVAYRGGFERSVGVASLAPRRELSPTGCTGRVVVGQRLLDDGAAGRGTVARELAVALAAELAGETIVGLGEFEYVAGLTLRWTELAKHPEDILWVGNTTSYVRATATLIFSRVNIPLQIALVPKITASQLSFEVITVARIEVGNRVLQWITDRLGGDRLATRLARREIDASLVTTLAPPPPFTLPSGEQLTFGYCDGTIEIVDGTSGALPFRVIVNSPRNGPMFRPAIRHGPARHRPLDPRGALAIDLDLDGANDLLFELWRSGLLDRRLADAGLDQRFNNDPVVSEFLTLRISAPRLARPPVVGSIAAHLALFADARIAIASEGHTTIGRVWGGLTFAFADRRSKASVPVAVDLRALELSCERSDPAQAAIALVPCYADLVAAIRDRSDDFHGELSRTFTKLLDDIFVARRISASGLPADLEVEGARVHWVPDTDHGNGSLHIELAAKITGQ